MRRCTQGRRSMGRTTPSRSARAIGFGAKKRLVVRSVSRSTSCACGRRSSPYVSSSASGAPLRTLAIFQARLTASCIPVVIPCPPVGLWICAASPAMNTRSSRMRSTMRQLILKSESQSGSPAIVASIPGARSAMKRRMSSTVTSCCWLSPVTSTKRRHVSGGGRGRAARLPARCNQTWLSSCGNEPFSRTSAMKNASGKFCRGTQSRLACGPRCAHLHSSQAMSTGSPGMHCHDAARGTRPRRPSVVGEELGSPIDQSAELLEVRDQQRFCLTLRNQNRARLESVSAAGAPGRHKSQLHELLVPGVKVDGCRTTAQGDEAVDDAKASEDF